MAWCILLIDTHTHLANWCTCWISVSPHASAEMHGYFEKNRELLSGNIMDDTGTYLSGRPYFFVEITIELD